MSETKLTFDPSFRRLPDGSLEMTHVALVCADASSSLSALSDTEVAKLRGWLDWDYDGLSKRRGDGK